MNIQNNPVYQQHKDLLFATDNKGVNHCSHVFGSVIFFQGKLRKQYVLSGELDVSLLKKNNFGLLDALGDDGTMTVWMMEYGFTLPCMGDDTGTLLLSEPYEMKPVTINQILTWVDHSPHFLSTSVVWRDSLHHDIYRKQDFIDYVALLIEKGRVFDMEGSLLTTNHDHGLVDMMQDRKRALMEKTMLLDQLSDRIDLENIENIPMRRKM